jgi:hypothetical protein
MKTGIEKGCRVVSPPFRDTGELRVGEHAERNLASGRHPIAAGDVVAHDHKIID